MAEIADDQTPTYDQAEQADQPEATVWTAGHGDDFTAVALCACGWEHAEHLADDGDMSLTVGRAEHAAQQHLTTTH
jgi:hypothetical protein